MLHSESMNPAKTTAKPQASADCASFCPPHGAKAICGRRAKMEDAYTAIPFLLEVPLPSNRIGLEELVPPRIATQVLPDHPPEVDMHASSPDDASKAADADDAAGASHVEALHFFGVFDGHGGVGAALHCARTLHQHIAEGLAHRHKRTPALASEGDTATAGQGSKPDSDKDDALSAEVSATASHSGTEAMSAGLANGKATGAKTSQATLECDMPKADDCDRHLNEENKSPCLLPHFNTAFTNAFLKTDDEFGTDENSALVGTTAVIALVGNRQLYLGNCGDSRAVLCRGGVAIPLTEDHKAAREDETARVEAAGGQILFWNGVRVMGVLAVSRAIGDHCLRPFVIAHPEVTIIGRHEEDELLLLASDGLWDVLTNQEAVSLARRCLRRARHRGASRHSAARIAATVLTRAALDRGSRDNITVLVVDLSRNSWGQSQPSGGPSGDDALLAIQHCPKQPPCSPVGCTCDEQEVAHHSKQLPVIAAPHAADAVADDGAKPQQAFGRLSGRAE